MNERAVAFGTRAGMTGIISTPLEPTVGHRRAVLMSNVGMLNRIGPFRLYVELARSLSGVGWWVLRFDESGLGDSALRASNATGDSASRAAVAGDNVVEAMDFLQESEGVAEFVLIGLCSGVDSMHAAATRDARVVGAVFIDGYTYPTAQYYVRRAMRIFDANRWQRWVQVRLERWRVPRTPNPSVVVFDRTYPPRRQFVRDVRSFADRGARALFIYTASVDRVFNAPQQLFEVLGAGVDQARISVVKSNAFDHLFTRAQARTNVITRIRQWVATVGAP